MQPQPLPPRTTWIEVSRSALGNNFAQLQRLARGVPIMAVVKANAYGHGAVPTALALQAAGAHSFAAACLSEALELRAGGVTRPILVLGYTPGHQAALAREAGVTLTVFDVQTAVEMQSVVDSGGRVEKRPGDRSATAPGEGARLSVHVKVNTGMNRLGVRPEAAGALLSALRELQGLHVEGIFSHFATSDELDKRYSELQFRRFADLLEQLAAQGLRPPLAHAANSAALLTLPHTALDLVRCGIALYGLDPDMHECPLPGGFVPALAWKAIVTHVSTLEAGEPVSYGREFVAGGPMRVAVIPVGYADGFPRKPRTWQSVLIRGMPAPILGRVCMDQTIVDISQIEAAQGEVRQGEEVVLIGRQGNTRLSAEEVSERLSTNNYDVVSRILPRVPRMMIE
jgi:alanine racemase